MAKALTVYERSCMLARMSNYDREDLSNDLFLMVKAGLLDVYMREDGQWVYDVSDAAKQMTDEEREHIITHLNDDIKGV